MSERNGPSIPWVPEFNRSVRVVSSRRDLSSDGGSLFAREIFDQMGIAEALAGLPDDRDPSLVLHHGDELIRTVVLLSCSGWQDLDDADSHRNDPALVVAHSRRRGSDVLPLEADAAHALPSQPTLSRFVARISTAAGLAVSRRALLNVATRDVGERAVIDIDSYPREAHGHPEGTAYNGHYHQSMLHPLIVMVNLRIVDIRHRPGNVHTAQDCWDAMHAVLDGLPETCTDRWIRADAGFAAGEHFDQIEGAGAHYVMRLKNNTRLTAAAASFRSRTDSEWAATPSAENRVATLEMRYRAESWTKERRVVAILVERGREELFSNMFFLITSALESSISGIDLLVLYRQRGSAEGRIGEFLNQVAPRVLFTENAKNDAVHLLSAFAYLVLDELRNRVAKETKEPWSIQRLRERILKFAVYVTTSARRLCFNAPKSFASTLDMLARVVRPPSALASREVAA